MTDAYRKAKARRDNLYAHGRCIDCGGRRESKQGKARRCAECAERHREENRRPNGYIERALLRAKMVAVRAGRAA
jgi:tRNA(Ile2) C34 agmatinyltransferase TiaS